MSAVILSFPRNGARAPGAMPSDVRAGRVERLRAIMSDATHRDSGLPMTETELDEVMHNLMTSIERARLERLRNR